MSRNERVFHFLLAAVMFSVPFSAFNISTQVISLSITNVLIIASALVLLVDKFSNPDVRFSRMQTLSLLTLMFVLIIGSVSAGQTGGNFRRAPTIFGYLLLVALITIGVRQPSDLRQLVHVVFLSSVLVALITISVAVFGFDLGAKVSNPRTVAGLTMPFERTAGIPLSHGEYGMFTLSTIPLYLFYSIRDRNLAYFSGVAIVLLTHLLILQSRSGWLAFYGSIVIMVLLLQPGSLPNTGFVRSISIVRKGALMLSPLAGIALIWVVISIGQSLGSRIGQVFTSIQLIAARPLLGYGWGNAREHFARNAIPHNAFLRYGVESGLGPLLLLVGLVTLIGQGLIRVIVSSRGRTHVEAVGLLAGLVAVLIEAVNLIDFGKAGWMWIAFCISFYRLQMDVKYR